MHTSQKPSLSHKTLRRDIIAQIKRATDETWKTESPSDERIHCVRRRCKRVRAQLRMLRTVAPRKAREASMHVRDASRSLSPLRDAQILPAALGRVRGLLGDDFDQQALGDIENALQRTVAVGDDQASFEQKLSLAIDHFSKAKKVVSSVKQRKDQMLGADSLALMYRSGRRSLRRLLAGDDDSFHQLRKDVKTHRYQCRFVKSTFPALEERIDLCKELGDLLGEAQDIAVLQQHGRVISGGVDPAALQHFLDCSQKLADQLNNRATFLACRVFFFSTKKFVESLEEAT